MAKPKRGMGRGLDAILSVSGDGAKEVTDELRELPVELIVANPKQPRRRFDEEALQALAGSLGERGVLQPVLVRAKPGGTYELVAGERRWRAAQIAGLEKIPGDRAPAWRCRGPGARADREHGARGPEPDRGGPRLRCAGGGAGVDARGRRPSCGTQPCGGEQPDATPRSARRDGRAAGGRGAERGPRPGVTAGRGSRDAPEPGARRRRGGVVREGRGSSRAREQRGVERGEGKERVQNRTRPARRTPTRRRRRGRSRTRSAPRSAPRCV